MAKTKRVLSLFVVALMTVFTVLSYVPAKAATTPKLAFVTKTAATYTQDQMISFSVKAANYTGKVEYRVMLSSGKNYINIWNTPKTGYYYTKWTPTGTTTFPIHWAASQLKPGFYSMTVLVKRVGSKAPYDSYVNTASFEVKSSEATISSIDDVTATVNEGDTYTLPATVKATMSDGTTADKAVVWDPATVDTSKAGTYTFTGKVDGYDKDIKLTLTVNAVPLAVKSVSAINAKQLKVIFTQNVDQTAAEKIGNYYLNNTQLLVGTGSAALQDDLRSVIITLNTPLTNGATNVYQVEPIASESSSLVLTPRFTVAEKYTDNIAPTVVSVSSKTNSAYATSLKITYSEPVASGIVKIDGSSYVALSTGTTQTISNLSLSSASAHKLEYVNLTDYATSTANVTSYGTLSFNVTKDATAPEITSVVPYSDKAVLVTFNKVMDDTTLITSNVAAADQALTAIGVSSVSAEPSDTTGTQFVVTFSGSFYSSTVTSKTVNIAFKANIKDYLGNALTAVTKTVTLTKDTTAPVVTDIYATEDITGKTTSITVKYSKPLAAATVVASNLTIVDSNGVLVTSPGLSNATVTADSTKVNFAFASPAVMDAKWYVTVPAGLVTDTAETPNASTGLTKLVDMSQPESATTFTIAAGSATATTNVITVNYGSLVVVKGGLVAGSATDPNNYSINGTVLPSGTVITLNSDRNVATITVPAGFISESDDSAIFRIANVQTTAGTVITPYIDTLSVTDNVKPVLSAATLNADNSISMTFSETVSALSKADLVVKINGTAVTLPSATTLATGTGADAGKWVLTLTDLIKNDGTQSFIDMNGNGTYEAANDILLATETTLTAVKLTTSPLVTSVSIGIIPTGTVGVVGHDAANNVITNGTTITVK